MGPRISTAAQTAERREIGGRQRSGERECPRAPQWVSTTLPSADVPRRDPALLIKITPPRSGEISTAKFMKLSRFIVLNELAFPKRSPPDKGFPVNPGPRRAARGGGRCDGGGRPPRAGTDRGKSSQAGWRIEGGFEVSERASQVRM